MQQGIFKIYRILFLFFNIKNCRSVSLITKDPTKFNITNTTWSIKNTDWGLSLFYKTSTRMWNLQNHNKCTRDIRNLQIFVFILYPSLCDQYISLWQIFWLYLNHIIAIIFLNVYVEYILSGWSCYQVLQLTKEIFHWRKLFVSL